MRYATQLICKNREFRKCTVNARVRFKYHIPPLINHNTKRTYPCFCAQGEAHDISSLHCDEGYISEAYSACALEPDSASCLDEADTLFDVMSNIHTPVYYTRRECEAKCVRDYILNGDVNK